MKWFVWAGFFAFSACSTSSMNEVRHDWAEFPAEAYVNEPKRPFKVIGYVQANAEFTALDPANAEDKLCRNYFNKAVQKLVKYARQKNGDAVIQVRSVVLLMDGRMEEHPRAECADEGGEAQVLVKGTAIKWLTADEIKALEKPPTPAGAGPPKSSTAVSP